MTKPKRLADKLVEIEQRAKGRKPVATDKPMAKASAKVIKLPAWPEALRAIPNHVARSGVFAPIARGRRKVYVREPVPSRSDVRIEFWGEQLDEADCDVWMQALHFARRVPVGEPVAVTRAELLRAIGRSTGKKDYEWLARSIARLCFAMLTVQCKRYNVRGQSGEGMHFIDGWKYDADAECYLLRLDPEMVKLFGGREFARIDMGKRLAIEHQVDMAKWLQRLVATSSDRIQRHALGELKERMRHTGHMRDFRAALKAALAELARLRIIAKPRIEPSTRGVEQAVWTRLGVLDAAEAEGPAASG